MVIIMVVVYPPFTPTEIKKIIQTDRSTLAHRAADRRADGAKEKKSEANAAGSLSESRSTHALGAPSQYRRVIHLENGLEQWLS